MKTNDKTATSRTNHNANDEHDDIYSARHHEAVFLRRLPELKALPPGAVQPLNADVSAMLAQLHAVEPVLAAHRARVAALPEFDLAEYDAIGEYAQVLRYAQARYLSLIEASDELPALHAEGVALRDQLLSDMQALVGRGIIPQNRVDEIRAAVGYKDTGEALTAESVLLRTVWPLIAGGTMIKEAEIDRAFALGTRISEAIGKREQLQTASTEARSDRERAFTLTANAYENARHALRFLRRNEGDVDTLLPSFWAQKNGGRAKKSEPTKPADAPADGKPAAPVDPRPPTGKQDSPFSAPVEKP